MTTKRTIYRYFETLREYGYVLTKNSASVYYISESREYLPDFSKLIMFSEEEVNILEQMLDMLVDSNPFKSELRRKLSGVCDTIERMQYSVSENQARNIEMIGRAMRLKQKIILRGYQSSHSGTTRDRVVEPYGILEEGTYITAYDYCSSSCRVFKTSRMRSVDLTGTLWEYEHLHERLCIDAFRMSGVPKFNVTLILTMRAMNLLIEEFPSTRLHIRWYAKGLWRFHAQVCALEGVGRFVLGLPEDIQIIFKFRKNLVFQRRC